MKILWFLLAFGAVAFAAKKTKRTKDRPQGRDSDNKPNNGKPIISNENDTQGSKRYGKSAKVAFLENIDKFKLLLPSLSDGTFASSNWTDIIISINNDELIEYWGKAHKSIDSWIRLLASWGLKTDNCMAFK